MDSQERVEKFIRRRTNLIARDYLMTPFVPPPKHCLVKIDDEMAKWLEKYHGIIYYTAKIEYRNGNRQCRGYYWLSARGSKFETATAYRHIINQTMYIDEVDKIDTHSLQWSQCFVTKDLLRKYTKIMRCSVGLGKSIDNKEEEEFNEYYRQFSMMNIESF